ncbi:MAG: hypothetical protein P1P84_21155 [Deferrisomatales bacterium]|nr:hypothetical protein [Deferrisomatales bacterium]
MLAAQAQLRLAVPLLVGGTTVVSMALAVLLYLGERGRVGWSGTVILLVALLLRLLFLAAPPQLSDDLYRYLWDGQQLLRGANPYAAAPAVASVPAALDELRRFVNHSELVTIYPPAAQLLFAAGSLLGWGVLGMKVFLVFLDLGSCALLLRLLDRLALPRWRAVLYAWHPLPVLEIASSGHIDGAGLLFVLLSCYWLLGREDRGPGAARCALAGAALGWAGWVKLFPFAFLPGFLCLVPRGRRLAFLGGVGGVSTVLLLLFHHHLGNLADTLLVYAARWEFAGLGFTVLRNLTGSGVAARGVLAGVFVAVAAGLLWRLHGELRGLSPRERACDGPGRSLFRFCAGVALAFLLLTPTLHPWYALSLAVFLPFAAGPASLVLCGAVFLTYGVLIPYALLGQWVENPVVTAAVCLAPVAAGLIPWGLRHWAGARRAQPT